MPAIGSSSNSKRGCVASAMAISSWRCSPWLSRSTRHAGAVGEPDAVERRQRGLAQFRLSARVAPEPERMAAMRLHGERDIVERGEVGKQRGDLKRAREAEPAAAVDRQPGDVARRRSGCVPRCGAISPAEQADQRGLAGAVRPDYGVHFAGRNGRA